MEKRLTEGQIETIVELLKEGKPLSEEYRWLLFEGKQETELIYAGKTRDVDVLTETMSVPLQKVKVFGDVKNDEWHNMLIFGDNLQVLKTLLKMKQEGKLRNADGTKGVRLIYIDPPFATKQEFMAKNGEKAYQDKIIGAQFLEWLRKRLILMRELLTDDGSIYVHLDWKMGHYVKILMDEIFKSNFLGEIVVGRIKKSDRNVRFFNTATDSIYIYSKVTDNWIFNPVAFRKLNKGYWHSLDAPGTGEPRVFFGKVIPPPRGRHWMWDQKKIDAAIKKGILRLNPKTGKPEYWIAPEREQFLDSNWTDISAYSFTTRFPTEKNEQLLERIIKASSNEGDIVLDAFAGSGTTGAVAEKLGRRWIMIDSSKFAIYTMIKRMLNLKEQIGNKGKSLKPKPFAAYNAGLEDFKETSF